MVQRKTKILEEAMKTVIHTPNSSQKSTTTTDGNQSETRDTLYFSGCRRDANCNCEICIASINATLDLMPQSVHGSSRTNFSTARRKLPRSPVSFSSPTDLYSPKSTARITRVTSSPSSDTTRSTNSEENVERGKRGLNSRVFIVKFILGLILVFVVDNGLSTVIPTVLKAQLPPDLVQILGEKSSQIEGLNAKLSFLENELEAFVGKKVSSCRSDNSLWKIIQDGLLLHSKCILYKSMAEEVSIWGWPLQTAGMLTSEGSSRSLSIISGSMAEWTSLEANYVVRKGNGSWTQEKWSSLVVQLDANTWILEYRLSFFLDKAGLVSGVGEFLKLRLTRMSKRFVNGLRLSSSMPEFRHPDFIAGGCTATPT